MGKSKAKSLDAEEIGRVLAAARGMRWEGFVTLALSIGARRGELCALDWADVSFENRTLRIAKSLSQTRDGIAVKGTKTDRVRVVPLSNVALTALKTQHALQAQDKLRAGEAYQEQDAIFADEFGRRITPMAATCAYRRIARDAGVSTTRLHDARHTAATHLLTSGVDVRTTAAILGHSSPTTTLAVYGHLLAEAQREGIERLGERLERFAEAIPGDDGQLFGRLRRSGREKTAWIRGFRW